MKIQGRVLAGKKAPDRIPLGDLRVLWRAHIKLIGYSWGWVPLQPGSMTGGRGKPIKWDAFKQSTRFTNLGQIKSAPLPRVEFLKLIFFSIICILDLRVVFFLKIISLFLGHALIFLSLLSFAFLLHHFKFLFPPHPILGKALTYRTGHLSKGAAQGGVIGCPEVTCLPGAGHPG